ncbi:MAG: hypothetical protein WCJ95_22980 [Mariniphaga sp.]
MNKISIKYLLLFSSILVFSCLQDIETKNSKHFVEKSFVFDENKINAWEIATTDSINHIASYFNDFAGPKNWYTIHSISFMNQLINHGGRRMLYESLVADTVFSTLNFYKRMIIIENIESDKKSNFKIILTSQNNSILLDYRKEVRYIQKKQIYITNSQLNNFINQLKYKDVIDFSKSEESFFDYIVTIFTQDQIIVYPYLNDRFSGKLEKSYLNLFK